MYNSKKLENLKKLYGQSQKNENARNAFYRELLSITYKEMAAIIINFTRNKEEVDEVIQEVMMKFILLESKTSVFDNPLSGENFLAWLKVVFSNHLKSKYRKSKKHQEYLEIIERKKTKDFSIIQDNAFEGDYLRKLPPMEGLVLKMIMDGYKYKEIAEAIDISEAAIKMKVKRIRKKYKNSKLEVALRDNVKMDVQF